MYSGGIDSYATAVLHQPDVLLNVDMGGRYGSVEAERLQTPPGVEHRLQRVRMPLAQFELPGNMIVPGRNAQLTLIAANYGDTIMMGSVAGSRGNDKDQEFCARMNHLLAYLYAPQSHWLPSGRDVRLVLPVYQYTKVQLVRMMLEAGQTAGSIRNRTFSCYTPTSRGEQCGECKPCGRKWAALAANGIDPGFRGRAAFQPYIDELLEGDPHGRGSEYMKEVEAAMRSPYDTGGRR